MIKNTHLNLTHWKADAFEGEINLNSKILKLIRLVIFFNIDVKYFNTAPVSEFQASEEEFMFI